MKLYSYRPKRAEFASDNKTIATAGAKLEIASQEAEKPRLRLPKEKTLKVEGVPP